MDPASSSRLADLDPSDVGDDAGDAPPPSRHIVLAVEKTEDAVHAINYLRDNVLKGEADCLHVVHVAKIVPPRESVSHGPPGTSVSFRDEPLPAVQAHVDDVRAWLAASIVPVAEASGARTRVHLFVESVTAPAADVAATVGRVADDVGAALVALSKSNKTALDRLFVGSVAAGVQALKKNVLLVVAPGEGK